MRHLLATIILTIGIFQTTTPVIGPNDVMPSDWFTPIQTQKATDEANRQWLCRTYFERTGLIGDGCKR